MNLDRTNAKGNSLLSEIEKCSGTNGCVGDKVFDEITEILGDTDNAPWVDVVDESTSKGGPEHTIDSCTYELLDDNETPHYFELWIQVPNTEKSYRENDGCYPFGFHRAYKYEENFSSL